MFKKIVISTVLIYILGQAIAMSSDECLGWDCTEVTCPDNYAVKVPGKGYLPCEKVNDYIETNDQNLLR